MSVLTAEQTGRWATVLDYLVAALPGDGRLVLVDGADGRATMLADRLAGRLRERGRPSVRFPGETCLGQADGRRARATGTVVVADGPRWRDQVPPEAWHLTVWARTSAHDHRGDDANAVVDLYDPCWPVLRHVDPWLMPGDRWYRTESRAFFAVRAATWDTRFGADLPAYATAIAEAGLPPGGLAVDVGCGTGRALSALREAVGPGGRVAEPLLRASAARTGWRLTSYDDPPHRFHAVAVRRRAGA
jgi:hypothetical protein